MIINKRISDDLTAQAKASPRLRMNLDLRNSTEDGSQRMLNAFQPGIRMPDHLLDAGLRPWALRRILLRRLLQPN